jgi:protein tyrosine/serine phosphatase
MKSMKPNVSLENPVPFANTFWVLPGQFLAGEHPTELDQDVTLERLTALLDVGVRTFVDLTEEQEKMDGYSQLLRTLASARDMDIAITRVSIPDRSVPSKATMGCILDLIDSSLANKNPVFVHCFAGIGRTGTVVGCHLKRHGKATEENVLAKISELRSLMPGQAEISPHTPEQVELVKKWQAGA